MGIFKEKCLKCWDSKPCKCDEKEEEYPTTPQSTGAKIFAVKCSGCWEIDCVCNEKINNKKA